MVSYRMELFGPEGSFKVLYSLEWYCMVMGSLIWYFMVCMIFYVLVGFSIVYANILHWSCLVMYGLVWPYAAMHNFCACFYYALMNSQ